MSIFYILCAVIVIVLNIGNIGEAFKNIFVGAFTPRAVCGAACGIALEGGIAVTYSIANFPTLRCLEQIRNDVCYHNANVKIVNIGGGVSYGALGISHHSTEDIAIMRALPNMVVVVPCDNKEAEAATHAVFDYEGPVFYRCGYKNEKDIHHVDNYKQLNFQLGKAITVEEAVEEAEFVLERIEKYHITMPVVYDWEKVHKENSRSLEMDRRTLTDCAKTFLETIELAGYNAMVYFNPHQSRNLYYLSELKQYDFWLASYTDRMDFPYKVDMWQYTEQGQIPGIDTFCDFNVYFPSYG